MTAARPSLDSQEDFHWLNDLHALSGCPKWSVDDKSPEQIKTKLVIIKNNLKLLSKLMSVTKAKQERQSNIP